MSDHYECPTCCYATNSYSKFLEHGREHALGTQKLDANIVAAARKLVETVNGIGDTRDWTPEITLNAAWGELLAAIEGGEK